MTDKKQILDNLMEHGKTTGKLTTKEITDALEKLDYDVEQMDSFYDSCAANNIEIIDDIITDDSLDMVNPEDDLDQDGVDISLSTDGIAIDDPVKIYLKEIVERVVRSIQRGTTTDTNLCARTRLTATSLYVIRLHAEDGVDFVTLHCGITRKTIDQIRKHKRKMNIVSRGGSLVFAWMKTALL